MADYINKIRTTEGDKPVNYEALANKPNSLPNPNKIKFTGSVVAEYDGSSEVTVNIQNGASEEQAAQIQTNTNDISELKNKTSELKGEIADLKEKGTGGSVQNIQTYITEDIGELYLAPSDYTAWCPCTLHFDKILDKFVSLIFGAPAHVHTTSDLYVSYIDKDSFIATEPVKCKFVASDGVTDITPAKTGTTSWLILNDGTYMMIHVASDGNTHRFISEDNGVTWKSTDTVTGGFDCPWYIAELSNGRLIASDDSSKVGIAYSDDKGLTWTTVIPATCGGDYEAEACILELEAGKLIAIGRYSMSGQGAYSSGDSEHAIVSYSNDYGTTWSAWQLSNTIDNMNASSCTGIVHNGVVEIFATSRWYALSGNTNTDNTNTGKNGALIHYTATIENALKDNFTKKGILDYAKGAGGEFHSPCLAVDDKENILICHMDGGETVTCNHRYLRGSLDNLSYLAKDGSNSIAKSYSAKYTDLLIQKLTDKVNELQYALSQLPDSGVTPPSGTLVWTKTFEASTASEVILRDTEGDFYPYINSPNYMNDTGINKIAEDTLKDNELTCQSFNMVLTIPIEKENCAIYVHGRTGRIDGNFGNYAHAIKVVMYMNNVEYLYSYNGTNLDYTEIKMEYNGGKLSVTKNGVEVSPTKTELTSDDENYGVNKIVVGHTNNNYACYRTVKFGEWDSELKYLEC